MIDLKELMENQWEELQLDESKGNPFKAGDFVKVYGLETKPIISQVKTIHQNHGFICIEHSGDRPHWKQCRFLRKTSNEQLYPLTEKDISTLNIYKYKNNYYMFTGFCKIRDSSLHMWMDGVSYRRTDDSVMYCRGKQDFMSKFKVVKGPWK